MHDGVVISSGVDVKKTKKVYERRRCHERKGETTCAHEWKTRYVDSQYDERRCTICGESILQADMRVDGADASASGSIFTKYNRGGTVG